MEFRTCLAAFQAAPVALVGTDPRVREPLGCRCKCRAERQFILGAGTINEESREGNLSVEGHQDGLCKVMLVAGVVVS